MEVDTYVSEILEQADEGQEIILEPEGECEDGEVEEIIEIIEEIEEDEDDNHEEDDAEKIKQFEEDKINEDSVTKSNSVYEEVTTEQNEKHLQQVDYTTYDQGNNHTKSIHHVTYDASADWEDEDSEHCERITEQSARAEDYNNYEPYNNGTNAEVIHEDKAEGQTLQINYDHGVSQENSLDGEGSQQEIIQNNENNLIYTVLGPKSQTTQQNRSDGEYVQVQSYRDDQLPENDTVYYALNEEDGTYQPVQTIEDQQQYEYITEQPIEQNNQDWEVSNQNVVNQEQAEQDQIYLHEDENGQLYFKNQHGQLQPVYLTADGNYAIAENSSDEQESQGGTNDTQEEQMDADNYVLPDLDLKQFTSKKRKHDLSQDIDNEDGTLTISMIISEDEHGQKRTRVIIPTVPDSKCNICNKTFKSSLQLLKHNRLKHAREEDITTRNFPCDLCPKRFSDQNSLARHRKTHTEQRPFQCLECHKSFPSANTLRRHLTLHNTDSFVLLPCIYCGRRFSDKISLTRHEQSHLAGEKRMHVCDMCQKCFTNLTDLNIHKKNHDPDRKFDCEVCGREFNRLNNLQRHMMVHQQQGANEEILSCNVCGITYKFSSSLTRHMVTTHMNPEKLRQQAEEQRKKRENHYRRYLENRKAYATQNVKRPYRRSGGRLMDDQDDDAD